MPRFFGARPSAAGATPSAPAAASSSQIFELPDAPPAESTATKPAPKLLSGLSFSGDAGAHWAPVTGPRQVKEPRTKGLEKRKRAVPEAFAMPAPPELLS